MDFNKPPKTPGRNSIRPRPSFNFFERLHPNINLRYEFYRKILVPIGHASFAGEYCEYLSDEFYSALQNEEELKMLNAMFNITLG